jgi:hypothetical protein
MVGMILFLDRVLIECVILSRRNKLKCLIPMSYGLIGCPHSLDRVLIFKNIGGTS